MGVNTKVTAQSARDTSNTAERLINCLLKNIKELSEMGVTSCDMTFTNLSPLAVTAAELTLKNLGFSVETHNYNYDREIAENVSVTHTDTIFIVIW